jgi:hypothetical protein
MTPFLHFRLWLRRAPTGERAVGATIVVLILTVAAWSLAPVGSSANNGPAAAAGTTGVLSGGSRGSGQPGGSGASGRSGSSKGHPGGASATSGGGRSSTSRGLGGSNSASGGSSSGSGGSGRGASGGVGAAGSGGHGGSGGRSGSAGQSGSSAGCGPMTSTDQGVTPTQIHIDIDVANLSGSAGNSLVGLPSPATEERIFAAAIAALNRAGGVRCRQVVAKYYEANALSQSSLHTLCLQIAADKPFALLDEGLASPVGSPAPRDCPPQHQIPEFGSLPLAQSEAQQFAPYLFSYYGIAEQIVNDSIFASRRLGWFRGAGRIGLLEQDCNPGLNTIALRDLGQIGFPSSKVTTYDFGCPNDIPSPIAVENAVLRFKSAGVTNVLDDGGVYENYFSNTAHNQHYKPKYMVGDQGSIALWDNRLFGPSPTNFDGALAITNTTYGAENTPGSQYNAATQKCDQAMSRAHQPSAQTAPDAFSGVACTLVMMFATAADNAPRLVRSQLAAGLAPSSALALPFPAGPGDFAASSGQYGGGYWRADTYTAACSCFRVSRPTFARSFR